MGMFFIVMGDIYHLHIRQNTKPPCYNTLNEINKEPKSTEDVEGQSKGILRFNPVGWDELNYIRTSLDNTQRDGLHMTWLLQKKQLMKIAIPYMKE